MKYIAIIVGACLGLAGCVVETSSGNGGNGGTAGNGGDGGSGAIGGGGVGAAGGSSGSGATSSGGSGGSGGGDCGACGVFITEGGTLCEGSSTDLFYALLDCKCDNTCANDCAAYCADPQGTAPDNTCVQCGADNSMVDPACESAASECANDI